MMYNNNSSNRGQKGSALLFVVVNQAIIVAT